MKERKSYRLTSELQKVSWRELTPDEQRVVRAAVRVRENAYAPYSKYLVGVAVMSVTGRIYTGVNVENVIYKVPHGEEIALANMAQAGERQFTILSCVAENNGVPCLSCRQYMREFSGEDLDAVTVIGYGTGERDEIVRVTFGELVGVDSFGPRDLGVDPQATAPRGSDLRAISEERVVATVIAEIGDLVRRKAMGNPLSVDEKTRARSVIRIIPDDDSGWCEACMAESQVVVRHSVLGFSRCREHLEEEIDAPVRMT